MAEVAAKLSAVVGKPIAYVDVDPAAATARNRAVGLPPYLVDGLEELFAERRRGQRIARLAGCGCAARPAGDELRCVCRA